MARHLFVKNGFVVNVVEYPAEAPLVGDDGEDVVPDPTGATNVGDAFDVSDVKKDRALDQMDRVIFEELFRLTNADRAQDIPPKAAITRAQYRTFLKTI